MLTVGFNFPTKSIQSSFKILGKEITDLRVPFEKAAQVFEADMVKQFDAQGRRPKWRKLSAMTMDIRIQDAAGGHGTASDRVLYVKGNLMRSFTTPGAEGHVRTIEPLKFVIGSDLRVGGGKYILGEIQTEGFDVPVTRKLRLFFGLRYGIWLKTDVLHVPPRPILRPSEGTVKRMMDYVSQYIQQVAGDSFKGLKNIRVSNSTGPKKG